MERYIVTYQFIDGVMVRVSLSDCPSVFKDLRDCPSDYLIFLMKLGHHKGTKVTEPNFSKKISGGHKWGENPNFWGILDVFCLYLCIQPLKCTEISYA